MFLPQPHQRSTAEDAQWAPKSENGEAEMVLGPGLSFPTLLLSSWAFNTDTLQAQVQMAFLLLCLRKVHSRPVAVRKRNESH